MPVECVDLFDAVKVRVGCLSCCRSQPHVSSSLALLGNVSVAGSGMC